MEIITLNGESLNIEKLVKVAYNKAKVEISKETLDKVQKLVILSKKQLKKIE